MELIDLKTASLAKKILKASIKRWQESNNENPEIKDEDFVSAIPVNETDPKFKKIYRVTGLYLVEKGYIGGRFSMVWSVNNFIITPKGFEWVGQGFYSQYREVINVIIGAIAGAIFAVGGNIVSMMYSPTEINLTPEVAKPIHDQVMINTETKFNQLQVILKEDLDTKLKSSLSSETIKAIVFPKIEEIILRETKMIRKELKTKKEKSGS